MPLTGPTLASVGAPPKMRAGEVADVRRRSIASIRATSSSSGMRRPKSRSCRAIWPARAAGLSSVISRPARSWARARFTSLSVIVVGRAFELVDDDRHQLVDILRPGRGVDAEDAGVGEAPVEGVDRVAEAALLAHLLEEPRRHAAAEDRGEDLRGVEVVAAV